MSSRWPWGETYHQQPTTGAAGSGAVAAKQMSQAALRIKAMAQLRQVLRSSPNRGALAFNLFVVLKYLPIGIMNKLQQFTGNGMDTRSASSTRTPGNGSSDTSDSGSSASTPTPLSPSKTPNNENSKNYDKKPRKKVSGNTIPVTPIGTPVTGVATVLAPTEVDTSVLRNVIEMNSQNNRIIEQKKLSEITLEQLTPSFTELTDIDQETSPEKAAEISKFLETNLYWQNIESRTKHLVLMVQKNATSGSKHNLSTHLDELFSHIYQHKETRNTAVGSGAVKILVKVIKNHPDSADTYIINRTREILALLGNNPPTKGQGIKILAIDGGGVRGLVALEMLRAIEKNTGKRIYELFDYVCGVSTGSILAFLLGAHRKTLDEAESLYKDLSREIFSQNSFLGASSLLWSHSYYHTPTFERILKKHCGEVPLISLARSPELPRVAAISTVVNQERVCPYVFRSYALPPDLRVKYLGGCRYHMWEAVRASAAAPTYFEEIKLGNYLHQDGGVLCNNPTSVSISEARAIWRNVPLQCVVSLGTGLTLSSRTDKNLTDLIEQGKEGMTYLSWKGKFLKVLDSATDTESIHNTLNELLPHNIYFRFNPYLSEVVRLDEGSPEKLEKVQLETRAYLERNVQKVEFACKTLLREKGVSKKVADWWYYT